MANSKAVSIRIPDEILSKIDQRAERQYKSHRGIPNRSPVVLDALVYYFNTLSDTVEINNKSTLSDGVSIKKFQELENIVNTLSDSVTDLRRKVERFESKGSSKKATDHEQINLLSNTLSDTVEIEDNKVETIKGDKPEYGKELQAIIFQPVPESAEPVISMNGKELGQRLQYDGSSLVKKAKACSSQEFAEWTKKKDPEGIAWERREDKKYYPLPTTVVNVP